MIISRVYRDNSSKIAVWWKRLDVYYLMLILIKKFWSGATNTAVYLQNRTIPSALHGKTHLELWAYEELDISYLRVFGCTVMIHISKEKRLNCDKTAERGIILGYRDDVKGYRVYNPKIKDITTDWDVIIIEKPLAADKRWMRVKWGIYVDSGSENIHEYDETYVPDVDFYVSSMESVVSAGKREDSCRHRKQPDRYGFSNARVSDSIENTSELSFEEAQKGSERGLLRGSAWWVALTVTVCGK